jgi:hypothetical protein
MTDLVPILLINLISYFLPYFSWHSHTLKKNFQLIFHDTTKDKKIIHFI